MKTIENSVLEMAEQIKAGMKVTEEGLIEAGDMHIGSMSPTRDQMAAGHMTQVAVKS
jgi:hypothetical protein